MKKRDRRNTPSRASITVGNKKSIIPNIIDAWNSVAVPESTGSSNSKMNDTSSAFCLDGEGTSKNKGIEKEEEKSKSQSKSGKKDKYNEIISKTKSSNPKNTVTVFGPDKKRLKNTSEKKAKKWIKEKKARQVKDKFRPGAMAIQLLQKPVGKIRVPVVNPDGTPGMPTKSSRARKWIESGKAKPMRTKTGIFYVQLVDKPSGRNKQPIVAIIDPGSRYTGIAIISKNDILYGCNLELIADEKKNRFASIKYRMDKRRELRRGRRYRNCRRRPARFLNRTKTGKMAPSIKSRKQLELKVVKELSKIYPISTIGIEDVAFNHYEKRWGKNFSQVEVGKKWLYEELKRIVLDVRLIKGYETNLRRQQLGLEKGSKKEEREVRAHVNDCIAMGSIILGLGTNKKTQLRQGINFDIITRPKYSRRKLHNEKVNPQDKRLTEKGHRIRKRFGGTTTDWTNIRKGDYVEVVHRKKDPKRRHGYIRMVYRGWIGGFENDKKLISLYNFDWEVVGQFDIEKVRLLNRNNGLIVKIMEMEEMAHNLDRDGREQVTIDDTWK